VTTCDEVRERLPEHVLGTAEGPEDLSIRRHLRGCAGCRQEMAALGDGLAMFAQAAHDVSPPPELHDRVLTVLDEEWAHEAPARSAHRFPRRWLAAAAVVVMLAASLAWGIGQTRRADVAAEGAASYASLLEKLGGRDFRAGTLDAAPGRTVEGHVVVYDSYEGQSWALVFVRAPGVTGTAHATLSAADGRTVDLWDVEIDRSGDGAGWVVTSLNLQPFHDLTVEGPGGEPLATAHIGGV
jgi:hypothetical protein